MARLRRKHNSAITNLAILSVFAAIEVVFCFTPLGTLPVPGVAATMGHIPVIISAFILDRKYSAVMGLVMGLSSLVWWSTIGLGNPIAFGFTPFANFGNIFSLEICLLPRFLIPVITSLLFDYFRKKAGKSLRFSAACSAAIASFVHSFLILSQIFLIFSGNEAISEELKGSVLMIMIIPSALGGIAEITVAALVSSVVIKPLASSGKIKK
ncbi:MAG: ECF transporter S component [Porcipelethomonas sp.]